MPGSRGYDDRDRRDTRHDDYRRDDRGRDSDRYHDDRREPYDDRRERFDDRRERFDDRRERYDDRREPFDDRRDRYDDRRDRFDDRRDRFEDRRMPRDPPPRVGKRPLDTRGSTSLFIGNLPYNVSEDTLEDIFGRYGRIKNITLGRNRETGQCRGFGFVTFEDTRDAEDAFEKLKGYDLDGRVLRLDFDAGKDKKEEAGYLKPSASGDRRDDDRYDDRRR